MAVEKYFLKNATIVNEGESFLGSLIIAGGKIEQVFRGETPLDVSSDYVEIDLSGLTLMPGVIDDQVHFREPGLTHKGDIASESRAAVAGGITSFMEMPNTNPQTITQAELEKKLLIGQKSSLANFSFYIGATNDNLDQLLASDPTITCGIKVFMGASTGNMLVDNPESLSAIFKHSPLPIAVHCEDETIINRNMQEALARFGDDIPVWYHPNIRNHEACFASSSLAVNLAKKFGTRLHILHLSTAKELDLLENSTPLASKQITAEACVHHLWFCHDDYKERGSLIKWNPAIKNESDRDALRAAIGNGTIDLVATDHAPHTLQEKGNLYPSCPSGAPLVQHSLQAMLELVKKGVVSITKMVELMCHNPAICFKVKNRGFIRKGYAADLVVVDRISPYEVTRQSVLYKCGWSPLEGTKFSSSVVYTFVNGRMVFENGKINDQIKGEPLAFGN